MHYRFRSRRLLRARARVEAQGRVPRQSGSEFPSESKSRTRGGSPFAALFAFPRTRRNYFTSVSREIARSMRKRKGAAVNKGESHRVESGRAIADWKLPPFSLLLPFRSGRAAEYLSFNPRPREYGREREG